MIDYYYKRALQCMTHSLVYPENKDLAKKWMEEESKEKLEKFVLEKKEKLDEKRFFYNAGRTYQYVLDEAEAEGIEDFNVCCIALILFEKFVGLREN